MSSSKIEENKIVLKVKRKQSVDVIKKMPIKELKLLNEIQKIEIDLMKQITEDKRRYDSFNNKKEDFCKNLKNSSKISKNRKLGKL